jgi:hypothetical protein
LIRQTWGSSLRTTLRFGLIQLLLFLPTIAVIVIGVVAMASGGAVAVTIGLFLVLIGVVALIALVMIFSAVATYARALIYRYATGRPIAGIDPQLFSGVFRPKGSKGQLA